MQCYGDTKNRAEAEKRKIWRRQALSRLFPFSSSVQLYDRRRSQSQSQWWLPPSVASTSSRQPFFLFSLQPGGNIQTLFSSEFPPSSFNTLLFSSTTPLPGFSGYSGFLSRDVPRSLYRGRNRTSSGSFRGWANSTPVDLYWFALPSFLFHMCHVAVNSWFLDSSSGSQRDACASDAL